MHALLLSFFAMQLWTRIWKELGLNSALGLQTPPKSATGGDENMDSEAFQALDADGDGVVSKDDLKKKLQQA